ncbi:hypothetical protein ABH935_003872 [Catenulispora sp. GAS73]|uniref:hypothetical protein n=1 Tax=Catenulispora sp. GAS73 TaxID=3156269 RepID=UPI003511A62F
MELTRLRLAGACGLAGVVAFGAAACASSATSPPGTPGTPGAPGTPVGGTSSVSSTAAASSAATASSASDSASAEASSASALASSASSSASSAGALPKSGNGDRQKVVETMAAVAPSGLPVHRTADFGSKSRVYQAIAANYRPQLLDLNATGYGDAESAASTYIVVLGQLRRPVPPLPDVVDGTLTALGATGIVPQQSFDAHAAASSLVMSCGVLPDKYNLCVWTGGTNGDLFLGAVETPAAMSLSDSAQFAQSVFGYVAP